MKTESATPTACECQCGAPLPPNRAYCSERCRNRQKQQRYRDRNRIGAEDRHEIERVRQLVEEGSFLSVEPLDCDHQPLPDQDGWHTCWRCGTVIHAFAVPDATPFREAA